MRALSPIAHTNPSLSFRRDGLLLPWYNGRHGAMFHAVAAVEAVLLVDDAGRAQGDGPLGAGLHTGAAADAVLGNGVALGLCLSLADGVALPEDSFAISFQITLLWTRAREPGPVSPVKVDSPLPFPWTQRGEIYKAS